MVARVVEGIGRDCSRKQECGEKVHLVECVLFEQRQIDSKGKTDAMRLLYQAGKQSMLGGKEGSRGVSVSDLV